VKKTLVALAVLVLASVARATPVAPTLNCAALAEASHTYCLRSFEADLKGRAITESGRNNIEGVCEASRQVMHRVCTESPESLKLDRSSPTAWCSSVGTSIGASVATGCELLVEYFKDLNPPQKTAEMLQSCEFLGKLSAKMAISDCMKKQAPAPKRTPTPKTPIPEVQL
jgi:hypothetical protein